MDNEDRAFASTTPGMPKNPPFVSAASASGSDRGSSANPPETPLGPLNAPAAADADRTGVFRQLVKEDTDIAGLVAYSIYKQNKLDWLTAFETAKKRLPDDAELAAYIIGEGTPRRLATYRHLAEATLAGTGPDVQGAGGKGRVTGLRRGNLDQGAWATRMIATYALIAVLFLVVFWLAAHFTMTSR